MPQTKAEINLNLSVCFKGYLIRHIKKLNKCRFHKTSYSPDVLSIAEHLTEACMIASFPGQLNYPQSASFNTKKKYILLSYYFKINTKNKNKPKTTNPDFFLF